MLHGAAITGDKEMLQKLLKSSYFDKSAIDIRHCVIFFRLLCPLKNQNYCRSKKAKGKKHAMKFYTNWQKN